MLEHKVKIPASPAASYPIRIGTEILGSLWPGIEADFGRYSPFVVTDENLVAAGQRMALRQGAARSILRQGPKGVQHRRQHL